MPHGGFPHRSRLIYSIIYTLYTPAPAKAALVVPLNSEGNSLNGLTVPDPPGKLLVTVKQVSDCGSRGSRNSC